MIDKNVFRQLRSRFKRLGFRLYPLPKRLRHSYHDFVAVPPSGQDGVVLVRAHAVKNIIIIRPVRGVKDLEVVRLLMPAEAKDPSLKWERSRLMNGPDAYKLHHLLSPTGLKNYQRDFPPPKPRPARRKLVPYPMVAGTFTRQFSYSTKRSMFK
jgi:hypothetical protein